MTGLEITEEKLNDLLGFIYVLENKHDGRKYIGKKQFWFKRGSYWIESDWRTYYGSSRVVSGVVQEYGSDAFDSRILGVFSSKRALRYAETSAIIRSGLYLNQDKGYNGEFENCKGSMSTLTEQDKDQLKRLENYCNILGEDRIKL